MSKQLRRLMAEEFSKDVSKIDFFILVGYDKVTSEQAQLLRRKFAEKKMRIKVLKNTIAGIVFEKSYHIDMKNFLKGPVAMIHGDPINVAKMVLEWTKKFRNLSIKAGYFAGQILNGEQIEELSKSPSKKELLSILAGTVQSPIQQTASIFTEAIQSVSYMLDSYSKKLPA